MDIEKRKKEVLELKKRAELAIERAEKVEYMKSTNGYEILQQEIEKELKWAFDKSVSEQFRQEVKEKPETYFEHFGYVNGLKQFDRIVDKILRTASVAKKDKEKWELRKSPRISMAK